MSLDPKQLYNLCFPYMRHLAETAGQHAFSRWKQSIKIVEQT
jgi:hypothetical protein